MLKRLGSHAVQPSPYVPLSRLIMIEMVERWGQHVEGSQGNACSDGHIFVITSPILTSSTSKDNAYSMHHDRARALNAHCSALLKPSMFAASSCAKPHVAVSLQYISIL